MNRIDRKNSKSAKRRERIRQEKHRLRQQSAPSGPLDFWEADADEGPPFPADEDGPSEGLPPISMLKNERMLGKLHSFLSESGVSSADEANALLSKLGPSFFSDGPDEPSDDPADQAQELAYDAMEAPTEPEARKLIDAALKLDPDCVDALVQLADMAKSPAEYLRLSQKAVAAGERRLGKEFFEENKGHFWGIIETRPYMRARYALASALVANLRVPEAISHFEGLIELCPNDNMGVRDQLLPLYMMVDHPENAATLLAQYEDDVSPTLTWGGALVYYVLRDFEKANRALKIARKWSPRVEKYLTGEKKLPRHRPDSYIMGSEDEAVSAASFLTEAWQMYPTALIWLHCGGRPGDGKYFGLVTAAGKSRGRRRK